MVGLCQPEPCFPGRFPPTSSPACSTGSLLSRLEVLLGPAIGEDGCAIAVRAGVLIVATDPITLTGSDVGRLSVVVNANDIAVMGVRPRWFLATVLLPPGTTDLAVEELFEAIRAALKDVGATLVGGHTEITAAVTQPVVVGGMLGIAEHGQFFTTGGARPGDVVAQVGPVPIEGPAVLVAEASARLGALDPQTTWAAGHGLVDPGISVVDAALAAAELGATALHDPTEGGLAGGLHELASAARVGVRVDLHRILWFPPGVAVCRALGADPMATLASGALLATFDARQAAGAIDALADRGHAVSVIGTVESGSGVHDRSGRAIPCPERDEVARVLSSW
jgi:hydrogenase expression/formation protein HypE